MQTELKNILSATPSNRPKLILASPNAASIVQAMPEEEIWLTIRSVGEQESLPIIALTSVDQIQYILDIELWKRDKWQAERTLSWLALLKQCGVKKVLQWVHETDADIVVLAFKEFLTMHKKESQDDDPMDRNWPEQIPPTTMEGIYYFQCNSAKSDEIIRPIFEAIAKDNFDFYMKLCEEILSELKLSLEESAFSWRTKRLAEKGFLSFDEAAAVYKYLSDKQIAALPKKTGADDASMTAAPRYPMAISGESYPVLMLALAELKEDQDIFMKEMASLANKVLIADGRLIMPETIRSSIEKASGYVNIGLEHLSGADAHKAGAILRERWVQHLFQIGYSLIARLRQNARKFIKYGWPALVDGDFSLISESASSLISGAIRKKPRYGTNPFREFKTIDDIREVERSIEEAAYTGRMFMDVFGLSPRDVKIALSDRENARWSTVFLTIWIKGLSAGQYKFSPVTEKELAVALRKIAREKDVLPQKFLDWMLEHQPKINPREEAFCRKFAESCFGLFFEEFGELDGNEPVDARFVQGLWVISRAD